MSPARFNFNGTPQFVSGEIMITSVRSHRMWALVGLLAVNHERWVSRDEVASTLWPEVAMERARQNLRQTLLLCKQTFGDVFQADRQSLRLNASRCSCDIWEDGIQPDFFEFSSEEWVVEFRQETRFRVFDLAETITDPGLILLQRLRGTEFDQLATSQFQIWMSLGRYDEAIQLLRQRVLAGNLSLRGYGLLALLQVYKGLLREAITSLDEASKFEESGDDLYYLYGRCVTSHLRYELEIARELVGQVIKRATLQDPFVFFGAVSTFCLLTETSEHLPLARAHLRLAEKNQFEEYACHMAYFLAIDETRRGHHRATERLKNLKNVLKAPGREGTTNKLLARVGQLFQLLGEMSEAEDSLLAAYHQAERTDGLQNLAEIMTYLAEYYTHLQDLPKALSFYRDSITIRRDLGHLWGLATALRGAGYISLQLGMVPQAEAHLKESLKLYEGLGDPIACASVLSTLAQLFYQRNHFQKALRCGLVARRLISGLSEGDLANRIPAVFVTHSMLDRLIEDLRSQEIDPPEPEHH